MTTIVTVHGTNASDDSDTGEQWWQQGSLFESQVKEHLGIASPEPIFLPFHWNGLNSEAAREQAALNFREFLTTRTKRGTPVNIIVHSHGGNVVKRCFEQSRGFIQDREVNVVSVGTPFLQYSVSVNVLTLFRQFFSNLFLGKAQHAGNLFVNFLKAWIPAWGWSVLGFFVAFFVYDLIKDYLSSILTVQQDYSVLIAAHRDWVIWASLLLQVFTSAVVGWLCWYYFCTRDTIYPTRMPDGGMKFHMFGKRGRKELFFNEGQLNWFSLDHKFDEAIAGLKLVKDFETQVIREEALSPAIETISLALAFSFSAIALYFFYSSEFGVIFYLSVFLLSYMIIFMVLFWGGAKITARILNKFFLNQVRNFTTGSDIIGYDLISVWHSASLNQLPEPLHSELIELSKSALLEKHTKMTQALAATSLGINNDTDVGAALIHNQYFSSELCVKLMVFCLTFPRCEHVPTGLQGDPNLIEVMKMYNFIIGRNFTERDWPAAPET